jgi:hypothetical protein
VPGGG